MLINIIQSYLFQCFVYLAIKETPNCVYKLNFTNILLFLLRQTIVSGPNAPRFEEH